jgi:RNA polymerase sigma factor (sigma-70 family)
VEWVHSVARRRVRDSSLADDVTQATFILLARKLPRLKPGQILSAWLFPVANFASKQALRIEFRRRVRETEAAKMREQQVPRGSENDPWNELASTLDELVGRLKSHDRQAVLLRFYERKTFPEIGQTMQISEEAARKRVSRAVEQLRQLYAGKGVAVGAAALAASLTANLTQPVSAAVIAGASAAPAAVTAGSTSLAPLIKAISSMLTWASFKPIAAVIGCVLAVSAVTVVAIQEAGSQQKSASAAETPTTAPARYGRVLSLDDKPVASARVWQIQYSQDSSVWSIAATATADADGRFSLPDPAAGFRVDGRHPAQHHAG